MIRRLFVVFALPFILIVVLCLTLSSENTTAPSKKASPQSDSKSSTEENAEQRVYPPTSTLNSTSGAITSERVEQIAFNFPLRFISNTGQTDSSVYFTAKEAGYTIFFTEEGVIFSTARGTEGESVQQLMLHLHFTGANPNPTIKGLKSMSGKVNYFLGNEPANWQTNAPTYEVIAYRNLYPGIDLVYYGTGGHLKSEFQLAPGVDPAVIQMVYDGTEGMSIREDGTLVLQMAYGEIVEKAPLIYQETDSGRREIQGGYVLQGDGRVSFQLDSYDPTLSLIIDPVLVFSSYLGGSGADGGHSIAVDSAGNIYVTGFTSSSDFPTTTAAIQPGYGGGASLFGDVFVIQIVNANGVYTYGCSTYLGGSQDDRGFSIAVDDSGSIYVAGSTESNDFPITSNAPQQTPGEYGDAFVTKIISASGAYTLSYSTYLGGESEDAAWGIAVDGAGGIAVVGQTGSMDFPSTSDAIQPIYGGGGSTYGDAFITRIVSANGVYTYGYSSFLGGSGEDAGRDIAIDGMGDIYIVGQTNATDFPTTTNATQTNYRGSLYGSNAFVTKIISASGVYTYEYSTYLGGSERDAASSVSVNDAGDIFITGSTQSSDFPTTTNALQPAYAGGEYDAFITKIISSASVYTYGYSSYLGGSDEDFGYGIAIDSGGSMYATGNTCSSDFPIHDAIQANYVGGSLSFYCGDAFVTKIVDVGGVYTYTFSTYVGGTGWDEGWDLTVDNEGSIYVTGLTGSDDFIASGGVQMDYGGGDLDAMVFRISFWKHRLYLPVVMKR